MTRKPLVIILIILGSALLLASITFWLDALTSTEPDGLGQQILKWFTTIVDLVIWISAYFANKKDNTKSTRINVSGGSPIIPAGNNARVIQVNNGDFVENQEININITPASEEEQEKNKRKYELRNKHEFEAPRYLYKPINDTVVEFQERLENLQGGYIGVFGPPGSGKSTFLTQTLRTLPVRSIRYYAYVPDAQDPSVLRGESINFFHDTTLQIQNLRKSHENRPDPTDRIALNEFFYLQLKLLGKDYEDTKTKTIILIDGLDHIAREQHPGRSLIEDLPLPGTLPAGVFIVLGSQTRDLPNLPVGVQNILSQNERIIWMGKLSPQNVFEIIHQTLPEISSDFDQKIFQIVDGHPLSLIYLLNSLFQSDSPDNYSETLESTTAYRGNIEDQYFAHWKKIENDHALAELLGLLARIRGPIPIDWVAKWADKSLLIKLRGIFGQYFLNDNLERWEFFHNSFRIFLEIKTAENLPGRISEQIDQEFHTKLAQLYEQSDDPYKWETLYHYYKAGDHKRVINIAQYAWFRSQVEALRPIDAIETDVRLATKSAGEVLDAVALMRYTLVGASLQQRSNALKDIHLPDLLVDLGKSELAIDYARDGAKLRLDDAMALSFSRKLYIAGLKREAIRVFELAEPLEYLSGRPISGGHDQPRDLHDLLSEWVESASLIRGAGETSNFIRRIQIEPSWNDENKDLFQASLNLQNWLLYIGALGCCEREDWGGWSIFLESLEYERDGETRYYIFLRTIEHLRRDNKLDRATELFKVFLTLDAPSSFGVGRNQISNLLSITESTYFLGTEDTSDDTREWLGRTNITPLSDKEVTSRDNAPKLFVLQFRYARLKFILEDHLKPESLLQESEAQTIFGDYEDEETKLARRQLALVAFSLAKLWVNGHLYKEDSPDLFLNKTKWIFDLIELGWTSQTATFRLETEGVKADISKYIVACAAKFGPETLTAIQIEFSSRWEHTPSVWWTGIQRETIMAFVEYISDYSWAKRQLESIEINMLQDLDVHGRIEECEKQANAWLKVGESQLAWSTMQRLIKTARGIYHDEDYQLIRWAKWLRSTNLSEKATSLERIKNFITQVVSVEGNAPKTDDALHICLQAIFDLDPNKAVLVFKRLLEQKSIKYGDGLSHLLMAALDVEQAPLMEVFYIISNLILPFERDSPSSLIKQFIVVANNILGKTATIELIQQLVSQIEIQVLPNQRLNWIENVIEGTTAVGIPVNTLNIDKTSYQGSGDTYESTLDHNLYLRTGEKLTLEEVCNLISNAKDLEVLLSKEDVELTKYFEWHKAAIWLIDNLSSRKEIQDVCNLVENRIKDFTRETYLSRVFLKSSSRLLELGYKEEAKGAIDKSLALTRPSGWAINWDGGAKYEVMEQMLIVIGEKAREDLVKLYALDLSERFPSPEQILMYGEDVAKILFRNIPYPIIWIDIEEYLDELFSGISIQQQYDIDKILSTETINNLDAPKRALANLLMLHIEFPAFPVSTGAIKASIETILSGSDATKKSLSDALTKHDQLVTQGLLVLEIISMKEVNIATSFEEQILALQESPNYIVRSLATKILNNIHGRKSYPPRMDRRLPPIYSILLPEMTIHNTEDSILQDAQPILLGDRATILQPLDIEIREIAKRADLPEENVIYRAVEKFKDLQIPRTWLSNDLPLKPNDLSVFLKEIDLVVSHNKPKIAPARHATAFVAGELYDAGLLFDKDVRFLEFVFRDYDPNLMLRKTVRRPSYIEKIGGLNYHQGDYADVPKDWDRTLESSMPLLRGKSSSGLIILGEWTHLKRLDRDWPTEERISLMRAASPYNIWDYSDPYSNELPIANSIGAHTSDYLEMTDFPASELVIAHNGYRYQMEEANWLAFNPRIGFDMDWEPVDDEWFCWKNKNGLIMAKSVFWQDGNFYSFDSYRRAEVGYGWLVLVSEEAYQAIRKRFGAIARGGVIKRSLGWVGTITRTKFASGLVVP